MLYCLGMEKTCRLCQAKVEEWNEKCRGCGFTLILEPEEKTRAKYLRTPSLGALFFTQGWALGARLYLFFALSLIPIVGIPILVITTLFGRRLSWKLGGWSDWGEFQKWMKIMDVVGICWLIFLVILYFVFKK
ncbi:MAG: hypothetical protein UX09_C0057G0009 [Candidatus Uhrbacteria bacterium GW2011_GWE2_45_35]|uniref:Uncharacterized protein n=2 Tax=Candidatus Uhriibacteriota TaxID=1752732 RepID=A0A0G1JES0_9BACT|nr:MAG: hypothetical protein UW63_C0036G0002 [Candidatus Uhrbacteria bacterium GW2011_GWF2_44_350]KKU06169.1 MAG: hypothetical protein UX09_C0057G0009 [Candidatus Uhrbacteria bacterium GW2011_GWE2_45_35]